MPRFEAELQHDHDTGGHFVTLPFDPKPVFGRIRVPVRVTVNGHTFRTTLARYGQSDYIVLNRKVREAAGVGAGDRIVLDIEEDTEPRTVDLPADLAAELEGDPDAAAAFGRLSYTHRREYVEWISEAKRDETRRRRIEQTLARLRAT